MKKIMASYHAKQEEKKKKEAEAWELARAKIFADQRALSMAQDEDRERNPNQFATEKERETDGEKVVGGTKIGETAPGQNESEGPLAS